MKKQISKQKGLWVNPRSRVFWFRRTVPKDIQKQIGKTMVKFSLQTSDLRIAEERAKLWWSQTDSEFLKAKFRKPNPTNSEVVSSQRHVTHEDLIEISKWWREIYLQTSEKTEEYKVREGRTREDVINHIERQLNAGGDWLKSNEFDYMLGIAKDVIIERNPLLFADEDAIKLLARMLVESELDVIRFKSASFYGIIPDAQLLTRDPRETINKQKRISDLLEEYLEDRQPRPQTEAEWRLYFSRLIEVIGNLPIAEVKKADIKKFRQVMLGFPSMLTNKMRKKTVTTLVSFASEKNLNTLSPETVKKHIGAVGSVFSWAVKDNIIENNPASGQAPRLEKKADEVDPYESDELGKLFAKERYLHRRKRAEDFWLPLISLYSGARLEEIIQLHIEDIRTTKNVWCFFIRPEKEIDIKSVKVKSSIRTVPIHRTLLDSGFLDFVDERRHTGETNLFYNLVRSKYTKLGTQFGKRFITFRRNACGINNPRLNFHSFRHTFKDACSDFGISAEDSDKLTGHAPQSVGAKYGKGTNIPILKSRLDKIEFLSVPQFHWSEFKSK